MSKRLAHSDGRFLTDVSAEFTDLGGSIIGTHVDKEQYKRFSSYQYGLWGGFVFLKS